MVATVNAPTSPAPAQMAGQNRIDVGEVTLFGIRIAAYSADDISANAVRYKHQRNAPNGGSMAPRGSLLVPPTVCRPALLRLADLPHLDNALRLDAIF